MNKGDRMSEPAESIRMAVEAVASNPKVATAVAASTASIGAAAKFDMLQSGIGMASLLVGFITGCTVLAIQLIKLVRVWRSWDPHRVERKD